MPPRDPEPRKGLTFTLATYNAHDVGTPPDADIVAVQESPPDLAAHYGLGFNVWQPRANRSLGMVWRDGFHAKGRGIVKAHGGRAKVTPGRHVMWVRYGEGVAVINTHAINNAFGPPIRGERAFRLRMWRRTIRIVREIRRELTARGYVVFVVGDLNRAGRYMLGMRDATPRERFDRIFYPRRGVTLEGSRYGERRGSDHRPVHAKFTVKEKP